MNVALLPIPPDDGRDWIFVNEPICDSKWLGSIWQTGDEFGVIYGTVRDWQLATGFESESKARAFFDDWYADRLNDDAVDAAEGWE